MVKKCFICNKEESKDHYLGIAFGESYANYICYQNRIKDFKCHGKTIEHIKLEPFDSNYYFVEYSSEDGVTFWNVGEPLKFCPYCGKAIKKENLK